MFDNPGAQAFPQTITSRISGAEALVEHHCFELAPKLLWVRGQEAWKISVRTKKHQRHFHGDPKCG